MKTDTDQLCRNCIADQHLCLPFLLRTIHPLLKQQMSRVVRKRDYCLCKNKDADQLRSKKKLISAFVFATWIVQFLFFLKPKFQASSLLLGLYRLVCVRPGRKPQRPVFSRCGSNYIKLAIWDDRGDYNSSMHCVQAS